MTEQTEELKEEKPRPQSKELKAIITAIENYCKKHDNKVMFHAAFMSFKGKDNDIIDDRMFAFGPKESMIISMDEILKGIKKEKEDFINW